MTKHINWKKSLLFIMIVCVFIGIYFLIFKFELPSNGLFEKGTPTLDAPHRTDFFSEIEPFILEQCNNHSELKKVYFLLTNNWFLSDKLTDFSQALTTNSAYLLPKGTHEKEDEISYTFYKLNENKKLIESSSAYAPKTTTLPFGFFGLTYELINNTLSTITYEDYIITYLQHLDTVFVWVRCSNPKEDVFIAYPSRPDLVHLETGKIYTLQEIQAILSELYYDSVS
ncbi:MAG: hypothetical protein IKJ01_09080 [Lachnospiraceae bacterium]|nr:hypothetical protein [Lachnospiraceae bacterium]